MLNSPGLWDLDFGNRKRNGSALNRFSNVEQSQAIDFRDSLFGE
jgi:hypothetical protein